MTGADNLLGLPETRLPEDPATRPIEDGVDPRQVATSYPASSLPWAVLAEDALADGLDLEAYAFARTGYHRGLDAIRRAGWRGQGAVPWRHEPNRGFLRAVHALLRASEAIGEQDEVTRLRDFLLQLDPDDALRVG